MASGTSMVTFANDQMKMRWREPYVTEGLNKKMAGVVPRGVYRGFRLVADGAPMILGVLADPDKGDHVAVYETDTAATERYSVRLELTGGDFTVDLTAWPSQTVYICLYAEYSTLATTAASLRVYTVAEYNGAAEKDELVILGTVDVPATGSLDGYVNEDFRTMAWEGVATEAREWSPVIRNGGFDAGPTLAALPKGMVPFWFIYPDDSSSNMVWGTTTADKVSGTQSLLLDVLATVATSISLSPQTGLIAVTPGQRLKWRIAYKPVQTLSTGSIVFYAEFLDDDVSGYANTPITFHTLDTSVTGSWIEAEGVVEVPTGVKYLSTIYVKSPVSPSPNFPGTGAALYIDQVQVWLEPSDGLLEDPLRSQRRAAGEVGQLYFKPNVIETDARDPLFVPSVGSLDLRRRDEDSNNAIQTKLTASGGIESGSALIQPSSGAEFESKTSGTPRFQGEVRDHATVPSLMTYWKQSGAVSAQREYSHPSVFGRFWVYNAYWRYADTEWRCDLTGSAASGLAQNSDGVSLRWHAASAGTWAHGAWSTLWSVSASADEMFATHIRVQTPDNAKAAVEIDGEGSQTVARYMRLFPFNATAYGREYSFHSGLGLDPHHIVLYNASYDGTTFTPDDTSLRAMSVEWGPARSFGLFAGLMMEVKDAPTGASWVGGGWDGFTSLGWLPNGGVAGDPLLSALTLKSDTDTDADEYQYNVAESLYNRNIVKAWVVCSSVPGPSGPITAFEGYNIASVDQDASGYIVVTLGTAMNGINQIAAVPNFHNGTTTADHTASATILATNQIRIACWANGAFASALVYANRVSLVVMGVS